MNYIKINFMLYARELSIRGKTETWILRWWALKFQAYLVKNLFLTTIAVFCFVILFKILFEFHFDLSMQKNSITLCYRSPRQRRRNSFLKILHSSLQRIINKLY